MPLYDYLCDTCGPFEERRRMAASAERAPCPTCHVPAPRTLSAPHLNLMSSASRKAEARNEKSAHAPDVVRTLQSGKPEAPQVAQHHGQQHKPHEPSRPWMIGH